MLKRRNFVSCAICTAVGLAATSANAQTPPPFTRKIIKQTEFPGDKYVCVLVEVDIEPNGLVARHTHPGLESTYFSTGGGTLSVKGQPDRFVKAGEGFQIPPEVPHKVQNGPERTHVIVTYIVEKDKPLASPAPE